MSDGEGNPMSNPMDNPMSNPDMEKLWGEVDRILAVGEASEAASEQSGTPELGGIISTGFTPSSMFSKTIRAAIVGINEAGVDPALASGEAMARMQRVLHDAAAELLLITRTWPRGWNDAERAEAMAVVAGLSFAFSHVLAGVIWPEYSNADELDAETRGKFDAIASLMKIMLMVTYKEGANNLGVTNANKGKRE